MGVLAEVLDLAGARMTATQVIDLAGREPVAPTIPLQRRRPDPGGGVGGAKPMSAGASTPSTGWRSGSGGIGANTWRAGLDRILLGVAMADEGERLFEGTVPSTTSTRATSSSPDGWPSSWSASAAATDDLAPLRTIDEGWAKSWPASRTR